MELCRFYGLIIHMLFEDNERHSKPHIHVFYSGKRVSIAFDGKVLAGSLPPKALRMLRVWIDMREQELNEAWEKAVQGKHFEKIKPLE